MDTNLLPSEKKSLKYFLLLYIFLSFIILSLGSILYYNFQKDLMFSNLRPKLNDYAKSVTNRLKEMHESLGSDLFYPRFSNFKSAIYDADFNEIFSLLENRNVRFNKQMNLAGKKIHFIKVLDEYYLGTKYVVIEVNDNEKWLKETVKNILIFGSLFLMFMGSVGYFLTKLFLKPMKDSYILMDNFIKDTTHELNTPVSAILANIETIDKTKLDEKLQKKINRIDIAARTISNIYQDLTYLILNKKLSSTIEKIDFKELIIQRVNYFNILAKSKKVDFVLILNNNIFIEADKKKLAKLIDNILSNAIKYNKIGGKIYITLSKRYVSIKDTGVGISKNNIKEIFDRFKRFSKSEGGFGIGLNIVYMIAKEFHIEIDIKSKEKEGTEVILKW